MTYLKYLFPLRQFLFNRLPRACLTYSVYCHYYYIKNIEMNWCCRVKFIQKASSIAPAVAFKYKLHFLKTKGAIKKSPQYDREECRSWGAGDIFTFYPANESPFLAVWIKWREDSLNVSVLFYRAATAGLYYIFSCSTMNSLWHLMIFDAFLSHRCVFIFTCNYQKNKFNIMFVFNGRKTK